MRLNYKEQNANAPALYKLLVLPPGLPVHVKRNVNRCN
jgi:hypothetical protein